LARESESVEIEVCHLASVCGERRQLCKMLEVADNLIFWSVLHDSRYRRSVTCTVVVIIVHV
jgi:hypothetical protein